MYPGRRSGELSCQYDIWKDSVFVSVIGTRTGRREACAPGSSQGREASPFASCDGCAPDRDAVELFMAVREEQLQDP